MLDKLCSVMSHMSHIKIPPEIFCNHFQGIKQFNIYLFIRKRIEEKHYFKWIIKKCILLVHLYKNGSWYSGFFTFLSKYF